MAKTFETIISVLDKFSAPIIGLEDKLGKLGHVGQATEHKLNMSPSAKLWHQLNAHVSSARAEFSHLGQSIENMGGKLGSVLPMLGAFGGVGSIAGILEMAHATAQAAEALENISKITGMAIPKLQSLEFAAQQTGVTSDQLSMGLQKLNVSIGKAAEGQSKPVAELFAHLGVNLRDANGHVKSGAELLPQLEKAFADTKDPALRAAMAMQLFGRSGVMLLPLLTEGPKKMAEMQAQFDKFGYTFQPGDMAGLDEFRTAWNEVELAVHGLSEEIGAKLAPVMAPLLKDFANFVATNRNLIALDVQGVLSKISDDLKKINWKRDADDVKHFWKETKKLTDDVGGLSTVLAVAGVAMTASFLAPLFEVGAAVTGVGIKMTAMTLGPVMELGAGFVELVPAMTSFKDVMEGVSIAMDANPLGVLVLATVAAGAAVYELLEHWKDFDRGIHVIFASIDREFDMVFGPMIKVMDHLDAKMQWVENMGGGGGAAAGSATGDADRRGRFGMIAGGFKGGLAGAGGKHELTINVHAPPGTIVRSKTSGDAEKPIVRTGINGTILNHRNT